MSLISSNYTKFILLAFIFSTQLSFGQIGSTDNSSNPTGGFGQDGGSFSSSNPTGGFGEEDPIVVSAPPPPPPDPIPLDGGSSLLLAAAIGFGAKKLYGELKTK